MKTLGTVDVCGAPWLVCEGTKDDFSDLSDAHGCCDEDQTTIWLHENQPKTRREDTLMHEYLHAILVTSGFQTTSIALIGRPADDPVISNLDELAVRILTPHLLKVFGPPKIKKCTSSTKTS